MSTGERSDHGSLAVLPRSPRLAPAVPRMIGYRTPPMAGVHRGLPSPYLTLVFSLSGPLPIEIPFGVPRRTGEFAVPVGLSSLSRFFRVFHKVRGLLVA